MARLSLVKNANSVDASVDADASKKLRKRLFAQIDDLKKRIREEANRRTLAMIRAERGSREISDLENSYSKFEDDLFSEFDGNLLDQLTELDYLNTKDYAATVGDNSWKEAITLQYLAEVLSHNGKIYTPLSVDERLQKLEEFAISNSGKGVAEFAKILLPELQASQTVVAAQPALPSEAPEIYAGLRGPETPPDFITRVYGEWLGHGLTRAHIRKLDPSLYQAIDNWSRKNPWPDDVDLPTVKEQNAREIAALKEQAGAGGLNEVLGHFSAREAGRIRSNIGRHEGKRK